MTLDTLIISLFLLPIITIILGLRFRYKQNSKNKVGGEISLPKALWLSYTVMTWFFFPFVLLTFTSDTSGFGFYELLIVHLVSWWTRGIIELFMIYKFFNWSPKYGISHDLFHLGLILIGLLLVPVNLTDILSLLSLIYFSVVIITTIAETYFAWIFWKIRGDEKKTIYFANNSSEWQLNNQITSFVVGFGLIHQFVQPIIYLAWVK